MDRNVEYMHTPTNEALEGDPELPPPVTTPEQEAADQEQDPTLGSMVRIHEGAEGRTVVVVLPPNGRLPRFEQIRIASALDLKLAPETDTPNQALPNAVETEVEAERPQFATLVDILGKASVAASAELPASAPSTENKPRGRGRTMVERRALVATIRDRLEAELGISQEEFIATLPNPSQRRTATALLNPEIENDRLSEVLDVAIAQSVGRQADRIIESAHRIYPDIITAELIEPQGQRLPNRGMNTGHVSGAVRAIMRLAGIQSADIQEKLQWSGAKLSRLLNGRAHPSPTDFRTLLQEVNRRLIEMPGDALLAVGLRPLYASEIAELAAYYAKERRRAHIKLTKRGKSS